MEKQARQVPEASMVRSLKERGKKDGPYQRSDSLRRNISEVVKERYVITNALRKSISYLQRTPLAPSDMTTATTRRRERERPHTLCR